MPINTGAAGFNALDTTPNRVRQDTATLRFDHQFTEQTSAWVPVHGYTQPDAFASGWPGATERLFQHGYQLGATATHVFGGGSKVLTAGFGRNSLNTNEITLPGVSPTSGHRWVCARFCHGFLYRNSTGPGYCHRGLQYAPRR